MKTETKKHNWRIIDGPERHRAMLEPTETCRRRGNESLILSPPNDTMCERAESKRMGREKRRSETRYLVSYRPAALQRSTLHALTLLTLGFGLWTLDCPAATVTGNLMDLSLAPLNTTLQFNPTNVVLV